MDDEKDGVGGGQATAKSQQDSFQLEEVEQSADLVYDDVDKVPEFHMRIWVALASMFMVNLVQIFALQGPPAVISLLSYLKTMPTAFDLTVGSSAIKKVHGSTYASGISPIAPGLLERIPMLTRLKNIISDRDPESTSADISAYWK